MKLPAALALTFLLGLTPALRAQKPAENPYDVLGKTLAPFIQIFAQNPVGSAPNRALSAELRLTELGGKAAAAERMSSGAEDSGMRRNGSTVPAAIGQTLEVAVEAPDKFRLRTRFLGQEITLWRRGQEVWAAPGSAVEALLKRAEAEGILPKPPKKYRLKPFELPIPENQLVFLPILFQVADAGWETVNGQTCRVLDVRLMPELAQSLNPEAPGWTARLWIGPSDYKVAKLDLREPQWQWRAVVAIDRLGFAPALPAATWRPAPDQTDVTRLKPARFKQLLDAITENLGARTAGPRPRR